MTVPIRAMLVDNPRRCFSCDEPLIVDPDDEELCWHPGEISLDAECFMLRTMATR